MKITLPDNSIKDFPQGTTGYEIAKSISEGLARNAVGVMLNDNIKYELHRPIDEDCEIKILTFDNEEGKEMFWHSSAHLMAEAIQELYPGVKFGIGPAIENGFYYDIYLPDDKKVSSDELPKIEKKMKQLAGKKSTFDMNEWDWQEAVDYYKERDNEFKLDLLNEFKGQKISYCRHGDFTDLCRGGHIPNTGIIKAVKLMSVAGAYWRGDSDNTMMTRIYGISFPKKKMLDEYLEMRAEAEKRDHRKLGKQLELFFLDSKVGAGLPVWLPKGAKIRRVIEEFMRKVQLERGYQEVITPHLGNIELYKTSGHYPYYKDAQFPPMTVEDEEYLLKPMNCPHHHQIYLNKPRSYRDLPLRLFEYGTVYRYEQSGELSGLSRVRGFTQDDAHIYCTQEQLKDEVKAVVDIIQYFFKTFGMDMVVRLSFRDDNSEKYGGAIELWEQAQKDIKEAADELELEYKIEDGEAAFYGPKIDFVAKDAIGRTWQLGTVQVDYVMPERFELEYTGSDNQPHRPVIIHRAPVGSMERFMSILIEHYAGNFPFWIAPVQINILPIGQDQYDYAKDIKRKLENLNFRVEIDLRSEKIGRKIAESEQNKIPFALIIGQKEMESDTLSLRQHTKGDIGSKNFDELIKMFIELNTPGAETY